MKVATGELKVNKTSIWRFLFFRNYSSQNLLKFSFEVSCEQISKIVEKPSIYRIILFEIYWHVK